MFLYIFISILAVLPGFIHAQSSEEERILGGEPSTAFILHHVAILINNNFACSGSLITNDCVVTSARCVYQRPVTTLKVRGGIRKLSSTGGGIRNISESYTPSAFNTPALHYDVAIIKLAAPLNGTYIKPIALNDDVLEVGDLLKVSGWGKRKASAVTVPDQLQYVVIPAVSKANCESQYPGQITNTMFCAGPGDGSKATCSGDIGSPAVKDNKLYAIASWGNNCGEGKKDGVFTSIRQVLPWIKQAMEKHCT